MAVGVLIVIVVCVDVQFRGAHEELMAFGGVANKGEEARVGIMGFACMVYIDLVEVGTVSNKTIAMICTLVLIC